MGRMFIQQNVNIFPWPSLNKKSSKKPQLDQLILNLMRYARLFAASGGRCWTFFFTHEYCLCNAVIIFTQGRRRSEAQPSCEHRNSDWDLRSTPAGSLTID